MCVRASTVGRFVHRRLATAIALTTLAACAPLPPQPGAPAAPPVTPSHRAPPGGFPRSAEQASGPAVVALLNQAREQDNGGQPQQAAASIERGLRIEPRNPFLWQALAGLRLRQSLPEDAENDAQKSSSLAEGNPYIEAENWRTIALARRARGDEAGAQDAEQKAAALQAELDR